MPRPRPSWIPLVAAAALTLAGAAAQEEPPGEEPAPPPRPRIVLLHLDTIIQRVAAEYVSEALDYADQSGAVAAVVELDTPGGEMTAMRTILRRISAARTPVVVYVAPSGAQAASAGFFILMAADVAAMAPGTNTGAAHPVAGGGEDIPGHMGEKVEQDAAATIRALAKQHGRNLELAEAAVIESRSYAADEALEQGLIEHLEPTLRDLLEAIDGTDVEKPGVPAVRLATSGATIDERTMRPFQRFLSTLANPALAVILLGLGVIGLYTELSHPGAILPGVAGAICLIVGLYGLSMLPVSYAGLALIGLGLVLFVAELHVVSHGILTVGGAVALVLGSVMLFKTAEPALRVGIELLLGMALAIVGIVVLLSTKALRVLKGRVTTGSEGLVGERGTARTDLAPRGKVFVHGEIWNAEAAEPARAGEEVEVVAVRGMLLRVTPVVRRQESRVAG